jgi:MoxR-like ATPase
VLVTGLPGIGKTSLGYSVAGRLGLGTPLRWNINSQTTLRDGLYIYDAVAHLGATRATGGRDIDAARSIGDYISLGPLGCAMLPSDRPRMLIVDEIDKANFDLAHDLLHVFEEGGFDIPELARLPGMASIHGTSASGDPCRVDVKAGRIITRHHPVVVITSNGVREFPEAFRRRCVELKLVRPPAERLRAIVANQLGDAAADEGLLEVENALKDQATDVVLQTLFLRGAGASVEDVAVVLKR